MIAENKRIKAACKALVHCAACRNSIEQRVAIGMPEICPDGWTADHLPVVVHIPSGQLAICLKCEKMLNCKAVQICKSCGGKERPRVVAPCPR